MADLLSSSMQLEETAPDALDESDQHFQQFNDRWREGVSRWSSRARRASTKSLSTSPTLASYPAELSESLPGGKVPSLCALSDGGAVSGCTSSGQWCATCGLPFSRATHPPLPFCAGGVHASLTPSYVCPL